MSEHTENTSSIGGEKSYVNNINESTNGSLKKKTVCLNMIIKNEAAKGNLQRCFDSVVKYIDCYLICDTGSEDNSIEFTKEYFGKYNIPGEIISTTWKSFGYNRTEAIKLAKNKADMILLLDGDMELKVNGNLSDYLTADVCNVLQGNHYFVYYNPRFVRGDLDYVYECATHEYLNVLSSNWTKADIPINSVFMPDHADGACRPNKFLRDIQMLEDEIKTETREHIIVRDTFYLANSYKDHAGTCATVEERNQYFEIAIKTYEKRISLGNWVEEVFYSCLMIGRIYEMLGNWPKALEFYMEAYHRHPTRAENIYSIARHYRDIGKHVLAKFWVDAGMRIPDTKDSLFITKSVYDYEFVYEYTILAWYLQDLKLGSKACEWLLNSKLVPEHVKNQAIHNYIYYVNSLTSLVGNLEFKELFVNKVNNTADSKHRLCNTSIILKKDGNYLLNIREVSYNFVVDYNYYDYNGIIDTHNHIVTLTQPDMKKLFTSKNNALLEDKLIELEKPDLFIKYPTNITGFEDFRLIEYKNDIWALGNARITNPNNVNEMILCRLNKNYQIDKLLRLKVNWPEDEMVKNYECQKNWVPFVKNKKLYLLYSSHEEIVLKPDLETGLCDIIHRNKLQDNDFTMHRGGSQLIPINNGFLYMVHACANNPSGKTRKNDKGEDEQIVRRYYYHKFLFMDDNFKITKMSPYFFILHKSIEFVAGMTLDPTGEYIYITTSIDDQKSFIVKASTKAVLNSLTLLEDLNKFKQIKT